MNVTGTEFINHYKILGVSKDASNKEIRSAYKSLCLIYHPDKSTGNAVMFEQINDSYAVLKNTVSRQQYDLSLDITTDTIEFKNLKNAFKTYIKTPDNFISKPDENAFKPKIIDKKTKLSVDDTKSILDDLDLIRSQDDLEALPEKMSDFNTDNFNEKFNKKFDEELNRLVCNDELNNNELREEIEKSFRDTCRPTKLEDSFKPVDSSLPENANAFLDQFNMTRKVENRIVNDKLDDDYFAKLLADRDNLYNTIEYSNEIVDGVDYLAIGF